MIKKAILGVVGLLVILTVIGALAGSSKKKTAASPSPTTTSSSPATPSVQSAPAAATTAAVKHAKLTIVRADSACEANSYDAHIIFHVWIKNTGTKAGTTTIRPWRRYNDSAVSDGLSDMTVDFKVPPDGRERLFNVQTDWQATKHQPIECRVYLGSSDTYARIPVIDSAGNVIHT